MRIIFHARGLSLSEEFQEYARKKLEKLARFFDRIQQVDVEVLEQANGFRIEATMDVPGRVIRAEETGASLPEAVDRLVDALERRLVRFKERLRDRRRRAEPAPPPPQPDGPKVVRRKRLELKPMDEEEAVLQMELLGHDFFVYLDAESQKVRVVYRRKDGNYGVLVPE